MAAAASAGTEKPQRIPFTSGARTLLEGAIGGMIEKARTEMRKKFEEMGVEQFPSWPTQGQLGGSAKVVMVNDDDGCIAGDRRRAESLVSAAVATIKRGETKLFAALYHSSLGPDVVALHHRNGPKRKLTYIVLTGRYNTGGATFDSSCSLADPRFTISTSSSTDCEAGTVIIPPGRWLNPDESELHVVMQKLKAALSAHSCTIDMEELAEREQFGTSFAIFKVFSKDFDPFPEGRGPGF